MAEVISGTKRERPERVISSTTKVPTGCGNLYITVGRPGANPIEIFSVLGKAGGCSAASLEAVSRTISLGLKYGIPVGEYVQELRDLRCPALTWSNGRKVLSCYDAIAQVLQDTCSPSPVKAKVALVPAKESPSTESKGEDWSGGICPNCGSQLVHSEGCLTCQSCGWSKC